MDNAAANIETVPELKQAVREMRSVQLEAQALTAGTADATNDVELLPNSQRAFLAEAPAGSNGFKSLIDNLFDLGQHVTCEATDRRRLLARALHILAETSLLDGADQDALTRWREELQEDFLILVEAGTLGGHQQMEFLKMLQNSKELRKKLEKEARHAR